MIYKHHSLIFKNIVLHAVLLLRLKRARLTMFCSSIGKAQTMRLRVQGGTLGACGADPTYENAKGRLN